MATHLPPPLPEHDDDTRISGIKARPASRDDLALATLPSRRRGTDPTAGLGSWTAADCPGGFSAFCQRLHDSDSTYTIEDRIAVALGRTIDAGESLAGMFD